MSKHMNHQELEAKIRTMAEGFRRMPSPTTQFHIRGEPLLPMQVAQKLQAMAEGFQSIRDAETARRDAEEELTKVLPDYRGFYADGARAVRSHFGSDRRKLLEFGVEVEETDTKRRAPAEHVEREVVRSTVIEKVIGDRETRVNEIDTEEVIETTTATARGPRRRREMRGGTQPSRRGTRPSGSPSSTTGAALPVIPAEASTAKPSKPKGGQRR